MASDNADFPVLDLKVLQKMQADYGAEVMAELVEDFKSIARESTAGFMAAATSGDQGTMVRFAHDLKSSAAALGLKQLSELSRSIEVACNEMRLDEARSKGSELEPAAEKAISTLTKQLGAVDGI
ncbi:MAG: Hpt domain-containing protein [Rhodospirillaceae bacterium]|nr:Hpt domain-containing protein [Rhodospirillaceae bacterium]